MNSLRRFFGYDYWPNRDEWWPTAAIGLPLLIVFLLLIR